MSTPAINGAIKTEVTVQSTENSYGTHDAMRFGLHRVDQTLLPGHKLERRLATWEELQQQQFIDIHRRNLGLYVPFRKMMERTIILGENARIPAGLCGNQVARFHMDILEGRDETLDIKDVFVDPSDESYKDLPGPIH